MFTQRRRLLPVAVTLLLAASAVCAHEPVADAPAYKVGDSWEFQQRITTTGPASRKEVPWTRKIAEVSSDRIQALGHDGKVYLFDASMNFIPEGKPGPPHIRVRYPLNVGSQWSFTRKLDNPMYTEKGRAKVVAFESITVPAGTFDCFRVEGKAEYSFKTTEHLESWSEWYCPDIKWIAKRRHEIYINQPAAGGVRTTVDVSELVKFTPGD